MRALKMKIMPEYLIIQEWNEWEVEDQEYMLMCVKNNHLDATPVTIRPNPSEMVISGKHADFFLFLYDVSYRYDVELI